MARAVSPPTLDELKRRGDHAIASGLEAVRILHIAVRTSRELRDLIDRVHHRQDAGFSALLTCPRG